MSRREALQHCRTVVVKIGTSVCLDQAGRPNGEVLMPLARDISRLRKRGIALVLVSSGAVGMGRSVDTQQRIGNQNLAQKQALAALGQVELMNVYRRLFDLLGVGVAQVLLTRKDLDSRERYLNARNTLLTLLRADYLPIINENDSVATEEIRFGDNDILSALVGSVVEADLVVNLTQTEGLLRRDSKGQFELVPEVLGVTDEVFKWVEKGTSRGGTGGMRSKLLAAQAADDYGASMVIAKAHTPEVLIRLLEGEPLGTLFIPQKSKLPGKKRWLAAGVLERGTLVLDEGACRAIRDHGKSLLAVGITAIEGEFSMGDAVALKDDQGNLVGKGLTNYPASELALILGQPTQAIQELLGYPGNDSVIHRDNLVVS